MAIGLMRMFGFRFLENFNYPYIARSIREFWRRWHISLSNWFRDYLYIPLGGNRAATRRAYANLVIVFLLCGLWHGASWPFVLWGVWHGAVPGRRARGARPRAARGSGRSRTSYALLVVMGGWVLFRCETLTQAVGLLRGAARASRRGDPARHPLPEFLDPFVAGHAGASASCSRRRSRARIGRWRDRVSAVSAAWRRRARRSTSRGSRWCSCSPARSSRPAPTIRSSISGSGMTGSSRSRRAAACAGDHPLRDRIVALLFAVAIAWPGTRAVLRPGRARSRASRTGRWRRGPRPRSRASSPPAFERAFSDRFGGRDALVRAPSRQPACACSACRACAP